MPHYDIVCNEGCWRANQSGRPLGSDLLKKPSKSSAMCHIDRQGTGGMSMIRIENHLRKSEQTRRHIMSLGTHRVEHQLMNAFQPSGIARHSVRSSSIRDQELRSNFECVLLSESKIEI